MVNGEVPFPLRPTRYERVSIGLTSVLLILGAVTLLLFLVWMSRSVETEVTPAEVTLSPAPNTESPAGGGSIMGELAVPGAQELGQSTDPPPVILESIAPIVESQVATLDALRSADGTGELGENAPGSQIGTQAGPLIGTLLPGDRWEIRFSATNLEEYKRQLDQFGIELGVAGGGISTVDYVKDFTAEVPTTRLGQDPKREKRIRFLYRNGPLKQADRDLAQAAGINVEGRIVFQFHSDETYRTLLTLEFEKMRLRGIRIKDVVRTVFEVRKTTAGYEFYVVRQDYRRRAATPSPPRPT